MTHALIHGNRQRRRIRRLIYALVVAMCLPLIASAQPQPSAPAPTAGGATNTSPVMQTSRPMTMEIVIVFLMFGAAIFVVCKSSRRN